MYQSCLFRRDESGARGFVLHESNNTAGRENVAQWVICTPSADQDFHFETHELVGQAERASKKKRKNTI